MIWFVLVLFVFGFIFGAIARALVPGPDPMSIVGTWFLGIVGSLVGGFLGYALLGADIEDGAVQFGGILGSIIGSVLVLLVYRATRGRSARVSDRSVERRGRDPDGADPSGHRGHREGREGGDERGDQDQGEHDACREVERS